MTLVGGLTYGSAATTMLTATGAAGTAYAGSNIVEAETGLNPIKDTIYGGNDKLFEDLDKNTSLGTYVDLQGNYIGGWKFSESQLQFHLNNGVKIK